MGFFKRKSEDKKNINQNPYNMGHQPPSNTIQQEAREVGIVQENYSNNFQQEANSDIEKTSKEEIPVYDPEDEIKKDITEKTSNELQENYIDKLKEEILNLKEKLREEEDNLENKTNNIQEEENNLVISTPKTEIITKEEQEFSDKNEKTEDISDKEDIIEESINNDKVDIDRETELQNLLINHEQRLIFIESKLFRKGI